MKVILFAFAALFAGASAIQPTRFIDGLVVGMIEDFSVDLRERGLDPIDIDSDSYQYTLPVTELLLAQADLDSVLIQGVSNIIINDINFSLLTTRFIFDFSLPKIDARIGSTKADVTLGNWRATGAVSGNLEVEEARVSGDMRIGIGLSGISIRDLNLNFRVGDIRSDLNVELLGTNLSELVNKVLGTEIPSFLQEYQIDINKVLAYYLTGVIEDRLP